MWHGWATFVTCPVSRALHYNYVNSWATQGFQAPPRTSASQCMASDPGSRPSATQSWPELSMATRPGQRTLEAARGNGYAPVRGTLAMMMMMTMMTTVSKIVRFDWSAMFESFWYQKLPPNRSQLYSVLVKVPCSSFCSVCHPHDGSDTRCRNLYQKLTLTHVIEIKLCGTGIRNRIREQ